MNGCFRKQPAYSIQGRVDFTKASICASVMRIFSGTWKAKSFPLFMQYNKKSCIMRQLGDQRKNKRGHDLLNRRRQDFRLGGGVKFFFLGKSTFYKKNFHFSLNFRNLKEKLGPKEDPLLSFEFSRAWEVGRRPCRLMIVFLEFFIFLSIVAFPQLLLLF